MTEYHTMKKYGRT